MRTYGLDRTFHDSTNLDVEVNKNGQVVAVWFRCQTLPFQQSDVGEIRSKDMITTYKEYPQPELHAVKLKDKEDSNGKA